jgi:hypothetical protein
MLFSIGWTIRSVMLAIHSCLVSGMMAHETSRPCFVYDFCVWPLGTGTTICHTITIPSLYYVMQEPLPCFKLMHLPCCYYQLWELKKYEFCVRRVSIGLTFVPDFDKLFKNWNIGTQTRTYKHTQDCDLINILSSLKVSSRQR